MYGRGSLLTIGGKKMNSLQSFISTWRPALLIFFAIVAGASAFFLVHIGQSFAGKICLFVTLVSGAAGFTLLERARKKKEPIQTSRDNARDLP
jgi:hypothetical protein